MRVGEHVAFSRKFLATSPSAQGLDKLRGFVTNIDGMIAQVHWINSDSGPMHVLVKNLQPARNIYSETA